MFSWFLDEVLEFGGPFFETGVEGVAGCVVGGGDLVAFPFVVGGAPDVEMDVEGGSGAGDGLEGFGSGLGLGMGLREEGG